ncbi:sensor histidine kinase [Spirosoma utsteinense]|uniref:Signal transduction histidine kinase internal region domain-containing protein n=1 Tax=Spirosoma utsteinense TaxID=2585773 RepID=A0ABR6W4V9_9BACT|nr:histidine kinase [Spirosoma utsteinense]MBC3791254.1 hypothetical protein [Spirosoma utsteinense]
MSQVHIKSEEPVIRRPLAESWIQDTHQQVIVQVLLWGVFGLFIRHVYLGKFYQANDFTLNWLSLGVVLQTAALYYVFSNYIFPRTIYVKKIGTFGLWFAISHLVLYEVNYIQFNILQRLTTVVRLERDWGIFREAGLLGFVTDWSAAFYSFFWSFPFAIMILIVRAFGDIIKLRLENYKLEKDKLSLELDFLKAQVNPHFLFNTLNSVYARVFDSDEQAADLILRLSELMRYNLYETDVDKIALDKELAYIQNYLNLERNRLSDQYVVIEYEQSGRPEAYQITPLLLIAFVENAFKHGVKGASEPAYVQVSATLANDQFVFRVENSIPIKRHVPVVELPQDSAKKSGGVGLDNVSRRLNAFYENRHTLAVTATEDTYVVALTIQLNALNKEINAGTKSH